jgi:hypothetical protein
MPSGRDDTREIIRFLIIKAAIFIGIPVIAAAIAVYFTLY